MSNDKIEKVILKTPKGKALWPKLTKPDTKYNPKGEYSVKLIIPAEEATEFVKKLDKMVDEAFVAFQKENPKKAKKMVKVTPWVEEVDDDGEETGNLVFNFKMKAVVEPKKGDPFRQKPVLFDSKGTRIMKDIPIGNGSILIVAFEPTPYFMEATSSVGITLRLKAAQVIKYVPFGGGGGTADTYGFDTEEDEDSFEFDEQEFQEEDEVLSGSSQEDDESDEEDF